MKSAQFTRHSWTKDEDERLSELVDKIGLKRWQLIASMLSKQFQIRTITGKACRERYRNHLAPNLLKDAWTNQEIETLFNQYRVCGSKWAEIQQYLPGRTDNNIKNCFYATLRRSIRRMLKALGKSRSSNAIGKIKPYVLTSLYTNSEKGNEQLNILANIMHDIVIKYSTGKKVDLDEHQIENFETIYNNLNSLNDTYVIEKDKKMKYKKMKQQKLMKMKKQKMIYKISQYISKTHQDKQLLVRLENKQQIFTVVHLKPFRIRRQIIQKTESLPSLSDQSNVRKHKKIKKLMDKEQQIVQNQVKEEEQLEYPYQTEEKYDLQFIQPLSMSSYSHVQPTNPNYFLEPNFSQKSDIFYSFISNGSPFIIVPLDYQRLQSDLLGTSGTSNPNQQLQLNDSLLASQSYPIQKLQSSLSGFRSNQLNQYQLAENFLKIQKEQKQQNLSQKLEPKLEDIVDQRKQIQNLPVQQIPSKQSSVQFQYQYDPRRSQQENEIFFNCFLHQNLFGLPYGYQKLQSNEQPLDQVQPVMSNNQKITSVESQNTFDFPKVETNTNNQVGETYALGSSKPNPLTSLQRMNNEYVENTNQKQ